MALDLQELGVRRTETAHDTHVLMPPYIAKLVFRTILALPIVLHAGSINGRVPPDSTYIGALNELGSAPTEPSIKALEHAVKNQPRNADALYRLGLLLMNKGPHARQRADRCLQKAIELDPGNVDYRVALGGLLFAKGFFWNAAEYFEKLEAEFPGDARAAYWVGYYALGEYMHEKDLRGGETPLKKLWADTDMDKAVTYLERSIETDPRFKDAYYQLGLLALEDDRPEDLLKVALDLQIVYPDDKDALLFAGLAYTSMSLFSRADSCFSLALAAMSTEERALMVSVDQLVPEETDTTAFWASSDPLYLTDYNERRLEHYSRVAYANLRFSVVWKRVEGWRTDLGRSYIRFGRYSSRTTSVGQFGAWLETWSYGSFALLFKNPFGVSDWSTFAFVPAAKKTFEQTEQQFLDPYRSVRYTLPAQGVVYKTADGGRLMCSAALPTAKLVSSDDALLLDEGVFVFDKDWRPLMSKKRPVVLIPRESSPEDAPEYLVATREYDLPEGAAHLAIEVADKTGKSIGSFRTELGGTFTDSLRVTEPLFAFTIEPSGDDLRTVEDLRVEPNPLRTYGRDQQIQVAFEIYNLQRGSFGQTIYEVAYEVGPRINEDHGHLRSPRLPGDSAKPDEIAVTRVQADYVGDSIDDVTYLSIDPGPLPDGIYTLKLIVRDRASGDSTAVESAFAIQEESPSAHSIDPVYSTLTSIGKDVSAADARKAMEKLRQGKDAFIDYLYNRERPDLSQRLARSNVKVIVDPGKVIRHLEEAIRLNPALEEAYHFLALIMMEEGDYSQAEEACDGLLARKPDNVNALLLKGLAAERDGRLAEAAGLDSLAERAMSVEERAVFYSSVDLLSQVSSLVDAIPNRRGDWIRSPEWLAFWRSFWMPLDPLYLTEYNERLVNHFGRFVYADLRFGKEGQRGAHTDYGRTWIKFGPYLERSSGTFGEGMRWNYGTFPIDFWETGKSRAMRVDEISLKKHKPRYVDPYRERRFRMPYQLAAFREDDSMRVELSYATIRGAFKGDGDNYRLTQGVFAFDATWQDLLLDIRDVDLEWPRESRSQDRNLGDHLVGVRSMNLVPGTYHFAVEVVDRIGDRMSTCRTSRSFDYGNGLVVSDLLLASRITAVREPVESRDDLKISPNPVRYFTPKNPVHFYFEIYNLARDEFGRTRYVLSYGLSKPHGDLNPASFAVLTDAQRRSFEKDLSKTLAATRDRIMNIESEHVGETETDFSYLSIDVSQVPNGSYQLNVSVRDLTSNQTTTRSTVLRVARP